MALIATLLVDIVRRILIGMLPDLKLIAMLKFKTLMHKNINEPTGGEGKPDFARFSGNIVGIVILALVVLSVLGILEHFGVLPAGTLHLIIGEFSDVLTGQSNISN